MENKKSVVIMNTTANHEFSAEVTKFSAITRSKPGWNKVKKETMLEMREKHHMTNAEIAKACGVTSTTVRRHIGCEPKEYTRHTHRKAEKIMMVNTAYRHEQKFASDQDAIMMNPKARSYECKMCGRKFYTTANQHTVKFCTVCRRERFGMFARGRTAAQIDAEIENKKKAAQVLELIRQATEIASTMTDKNILPFPEVK